MDTGKRLAEIWRADYMGALPVSVKERGYTYAENVRKDILITGFNPSFRPGDSAGIFSGPISNIWKSQQYDTYFSPIRKMLYDGELDLRDQADYLDIFYFREREQRFLKNRILSNPEGIRFITDQLNLTMHIIEDVVKPNLLIVKNKEAWPYFGKLFDEKGWVWMGYRFDPVEQMPCGELCRITGLIDSKERIAPEIQQTNLMGSFVLFSKHINQYTARNIRPTPWIIKSILDRYSPNPN